MKKGTRNSREAILAAAMGLFAEKGYAATSTREICAAAGITKPVLYYHFRSKGHLYEELMIDSFSHFHKVWLRGPRARGTFRQRLTRVLYNDLKSARDEPVRVRFLTRMIFSPEERRPEFDAIEQMEQQRRILVALFRDGIRNREVQGDPYQLATVLMGMNLITVLEHHFTGRPTLTLRNAERLVNILLDGCVTNNPYTGRYNNHAQS